MSRENLFKILSKLLFYTSEKGHRCGSVIEMIGGIHSRVSLEAFRRRNFFRFLVFRDGGDLGRGC